MDDDIRDTIRSALSNYRGDDLERAKSAFRNFDAKQMQEQHGFSGKTRQQIVDGYEAHVADITAAFIWLESQP